MANRKGKGMTKGRLIFICTWLAVFAVAYLIWAAVLYGVTKELREYESYQPHSAAEKAFDELFADADAEEIVGYGGYTLSYYESKDAVIGYIDSLISDKTLTYREKSSDDSRVTYEVLSDGAVFAEFTVVKDESSREIFGEKCYVTGDVKLCIEAPGRAIVIAPKNATVKLNGIEVGETLRVGEYIELPDAVYFPDEESRLMSQYFVSGLFGTPTVTVEDADGTLYGVEYDRTHGVYDTEYSYRTRLSEAHGASGNGQ